MKIRRIRRKIRILRLDVVLLVSLLSSSQFKGTWRGTEASACQICGRYFQLASTLESLIRRSPEIGDPLTAFASALERVNSPATEVMEIGGRILSYISLRVLRKKERSIYKRTSIRYIIIKP